MGNNPKSISLLISIYGKPKSLYMVRAITINGIGCTVRTLDNTSFRESPGVPLGAERPYFASLAHKHSNLCDPRRLPSWICIPRHVRKRICKEEPGFNHLNMGRKIWFHDFEDTAHSGRLMVCLRSVLTPGPPRAWWAISANLRANHRASGLTDFAASPPQ